MTTHNEFLWGVAISSHQNEGAAAESDWGHAEMKGRLPARCGPGANFRELLDEDLDLAAGLGLNAFRTSIEWARLEPRPGEWDAEEVAYLHRKFQGLRERGMKIVATLQHYTTPQWLGDGFLRVGWEDPKSAAAFERYARFVAEEFGGYIDYWVTFNEPALMLAGGYLSAKIPPFRWGPVSFAQACRVLMEAHKRAYRVLHELNPRAMVSYSDFTGVMPLGPNLSLDLTPARYWSPLAMEERDADGELRAKYLDYICLHYYGIVPFQETFGFPMRPYNLGTSPEDFKRILARYHDAYNLPILVGENGCATENHQPRRDGWTPSQYMLAHVEAMQQAQAEGVPVLGYFWWTLTDNYEWGSFSPRFGLWRVECQAGDFKRVPTEAVETYRRIVQARGVPAELRR